MYKKVLAMLLCSTLLFLSNTSSSNASPSSEAPAAATPASTPLPASEPVMENTDVSTLPQSLANFFQQFGAAYVNPIYDPELDNVMEYDAERAGDGSTNILSSIASEMSCVIFQDYPVAIPESVWNSTDPVGWSTTGAYEIFDGPSIDWIAINIFNATEEDLDSMVKQGEERQLFKRLEGENGSYTYYIPIGGVGGPGFQIKFLWAQSDGTNYRLVYNKYVNMGNEDLSQQSPEGTYYTEMEDKVIDGEHYWSMHYHSEKIPEDVASGDTAPTNTAPTNTGTWQDAYEDFVMSGKYLESGDTRGYDQPSAHFFGLHDMNDDNTPELLICNGFNGRDLRAYYIFTYDGSNVVYCGSTLADSFTAPSYPGMFSSVGMTGYYLENEYIGVYSEVTYLNYYSLVDNEIVKEQVYILGTPVDGNERVYIYKTDNEDLYNASQGAYEKFKTLSKEELETQGWDAFLDLYE